MGRNGQPAGQQATELAAKSGKNLVLVTGGAGYIGCLLVRRLLDRQYRVRVLDALLYGDSAIRDLLAHPRFELVVGDFRRPDVAATALDGVAAVIHLGAIVGDPACALDEDFTIETNYEATLTLVNACKAQQIHRFLFASTCSVYGASDQPLDESSSLNPVSLYANTKIASEEAILAARDDHFSPTILRFGTAYGASHRPRFDLVINLLTAKAVIDGVITIHGGNQWRPFVHADDIGRALILSLEAPIGQVAGEIFNAGSTEQNYQLGKIGDIIRQVIPATDVVINDAIIDRRNYYVRFEKIRSILGFEVEHDVHSAVAELATALRLGMIGNPDDRHYNNFHFLKEAEPHIRSLVGTARPSRHSTDT